MLLPARYNFNLFNKIIVDKDNTLTSMMKLSSKSSNKLFNKTS